MKAHDDRSWWYLLICLRLTIMMIFVIKNIYMSKSRDYYSHVPMLEQNGVTKQPLRTGEGKAFPLQWFIKYCHPPSCIQFELVLLSQWALIFRKELAGETKQHSRSGANRTRRCRLFALSFSPAIFLPIYPQPSLLEAFSSLLSISLVTFWHDL